jgi:hypothetical protein
LQEDYGVVEGRGAEMKKIDPVYDFAGRIAKAMKDVASSHVLFIYQQAFGDEDSWDEVVTALDSIIALCAVRKH